SRANYLSDWADWADLVLSSSVTTCSVTVPPSGISGAIGGTLAVAITASSTCPWSSSSNAPWLVVTSGSGNGSGNVVLTVLPNAGSARAGTVMIAGHTF